VKIAFDTPLTGTDQSGAVVTLTPAQIAALTFTVFVDTANPPVQKYPVPAANITAATANANGSKRVTVDAVKDLGLTITAGTEYFVAVEDSLGTAISPETAVLTYMDVVTPGAPQNPSVA
jgi:hypothetical protein